MAYVFALRVWLVALSMFVFIAFGLIAMWIVRVGILMNTPVVSGEVQSINQGNDMLSGKAYRYVTVKVPYQLVTLVLEENEPTISVGDVIPVRVFRDSARYDSMTELYEIPRLAVTTLLLAIFLVPTFWVLRRYKLAIAPYDPLWFHGAVWVSVAFAIVIILSELLVRR